VSDEQNMTGTSIAVVVMIGSVALMGWTLFGKPGQRGRAIRAERGGVPNKSFVLSIVAAVVLIVVAVVWRSRSN
jgi:hypothetical protein